MSDKKGKTRTFEGPKQPDEKKKRKPTFGLHDLNPVIDDDGNIRPLWDIAFEGTHWGNLIETAPDAPQKEWLRTMVREFCAKGDAIISKTRQVTSTEEYQRKMAEGDPRLDKLVERLQNGSMTQTSSIFKDFEKNLDDIVNGDAAPAKGTEETE